MPSSGMLRRVILVRTEVSEERMASVSRVMLHVPPKRRSYNTTGRNIPLDGILQLQLSI
jgi:hypothetical protein